MALPNYGPTMSTALPTCFPCCWAPCPLGQIPVYTSTVIYTASQPTPSSNRSLETCPRHTQVPGAWRALQVLSTLGTLSRSNSHLLEKQLMEPGPILSDSPFPTHARDTGLSPAPWSPLLEGGAVSLCPGFPLASPSGQHMPSLSHVGQRCPQAPLQAALPSLPEGTATHLWPHSKHPGAASC